MTSPTINSMIKLYIESSKVEQLKCGRPCDNTIRNTLTGTKRFLSWMASCKKDGANSGESTDIKACEVNPRIIRRYLTYLLSSGMRPISAMSFVCQFRQLFAKWMRPYYEDAGWVVPAFPQLSRAAVVSRYNRPAPEVLGKVKEWYYNLAPDMVWFIATMMLEFAMRNGDITRLKRGNFVESDGRVYLNYTPNKTAHSSGRVVKWPVHPNIWKVLSIFKPWEKKIQEKHFDKLNRDMRDLGFVGTKGAYELRKICIDHVYQKFGAEMAVSISGDDIRTITRYYADPAQPNMGNVRVTDLIVGSSENA